MLRSTIISFVLILGACATKLEPFSLPVSADYGPQESGYAVDWVSNNEIEVTVAVEPRRGFGYAEDAASFLAATAAEAKRFEVVTPIDGRSSDSVCVDWCPVYYIFRAYSLSEVPVSPSSLKVQTILSNMSKKFK